MDTTAKLQKFKEITQRMCSLYEQKNKDYGDSFGKSFKKHGYAMPSIRLEDKLNRYDSLTKDLKPGDVIKQGLVKDESVKDTLIDLANYAVMTIIEIEMQERELK